MTAPQPLYVTIAGRTRHSGGRWHRDRACDFLIQPRRRREVPLTVALALGYHECPYCAPPPPCCLADAHGGTAITPAVPLAPSELPDWERELLLENAELPPDE